MYSARQCHYLSERIAGKIIEIGIAIEIETSCYPDLFDSDFDSDFDTEKNSSIAFMARLTSFGGPSVRVASGALVLLRLGRQKGLVRPIKQALPIG